MPSNLVKSYAEKTGMSVEEVEKKWNEAKAIVKNEYKDIAPESEKYYALLVSIFKKMLKVKTEDIAATNTTSMGGRDAIYANKIGSMKRIKKVMNKKTFEEGEFLDKINLILEKEER